MNFMFLLFAVLLCAGAIPKELGALSKLERLLLGNNQLSGEGGSTELHRYKVRFSRSLFRSVGTNVLRPGCVTIFVQCCMLLVVQDASPKS